MPEELSDVGAEEVSCCEAGGHTPRELVQADGVALDPGGSRIEGVEGARIHDEVCAGGQQVPRGPPGDQVDGVDQPPPGTRRDRPRHHRYFTGKDDLMSHVIAYGVRRMLNAMRGTRTTSRRGIAPRNSSPDKSPPLLDGCSVCRPPSRN